MRRNQGRVGANSYLDDESPQSRTTTDEGRGTKIDSWSDDDSDAQELYESQNEGSDLDEGAIYPMDHDIRARLREDLYQLSQDGRPAKLEATLEFWEKAKTRTEPYFIHILREKYPEEPLDLYSLRGDDRLLAEAVKEACHRAGFILLLGNLRHKRHGAVLDEDEVWQRVGADWRIYRPNGSKRATASGHRYYHDEDLRSRHTIGDLWGEWWHLSRMHDTSGHVVTGEIKTDEAKIVQEDAFLGCEPDEEVYPVGYDECYGDLVMHWYHSAVSILLDLSSPFIDDDKGDDHSTTGQSFGFT